MKLFKTTACLAVNRRRAKTDFCSYKCPSARVGGAWPGLHRHRWDLIFRTLPWGPSLACASFFSFCHASSLPSTDQYARRRLLLPPPPPAEKSKREDTL